MPTEKPKTLPLDLYLKRAEAHKYFNMLWANGRFTKRGAYKWLKKTMHLKSSTAHFSKLDIEGCDKVIAVIKKNIKLTYNFRD